MTDDGMGEMGVRTVAIDGKGKKKEAEAGQDDMEKDDKLDVDS